MDEYGLLKYWPVSEHGSDVLSSYVLSIASEAGWTIPQDSLDKFGGAYKVLSKETIPDSSRGLRNKLATKQKTRGARTLSSVYDAKQVSLLSKPPDHSSPKTWSTSNVIGLVVYLKLAGSFLIARPAHRS